MSLRARTGRFGEQAAADHLARAGYEVVDRNFRTRFGELDLVVADRRCLVFCEVKTRVAGTRAGPLGPLDAVGPEKRRRVRMMAVQWLADSASPARPSRPELRFDAIGVTLSPGHEVLSLEHVEDAF